MRLVSTAALAAAQWDSLREIGTLKVRPITFQSGTSELGVEGRSDRGSCW